MEAANTPIRVSLPQKVRYTLEQTTGLPIRVMYRGPHWSICSLPGVWCLRAVAPACDGRPLIWRETLIYDHCRGREPRDEAISCVVVLPTVPQGQG
eukprot:4679360-Amphidinium_carterae.1